MHRALQRLTDPKQVAESFWGWHSGWHGRQCLSLTYSRGSLKEGMVVRGLGYPCIPSAAPPQPLLPLQDAALLHALRAPQEMAAADTLGRAWSPAVALGTQRVAGQAFSSCSEEGPQETLRGDPRPPRTRGQVLGHARRGRGLRFQSRGGGSVPRQRGGTSWKPCPPPLQATAGHAAQGHRFLGTGCPRCWASCLTTLSLRPVATVEQGLVRVPEEQVPGHRMHKTEVGIAVD